MAIPVVEQLKADLHDQPSNPLRPNQVQGYQDELQQLGAAVQGRDLDGVPRDFLKPVGGSARRRIQEIRGVLDKQTAKRVTGDRANSIHARIKETLETVIKPGMLPRSAGRRNVPGAVGHVLRTEFNPVFKDAVLTVKRGLRALDPDNTDPDFTNMERFRPEGLNPDGTSTFKADAQIPGVFAFTPAAKDAWPLGEPTARTAFGEAKEREAATERPAGVAVASISGREPVASRPEKKPKKAKRVSNLTAEQRAEIGARLKAARERKQATT